MKENRGGYLFALLVLIGAVSIIVAQQVAHKERHQQMLNNEIKRADEFQKAVWADVDHYCRQICGEDRSG